MGLMDKLKAASTIKETAVLDESKFFTEKEYVSTDVPAINIAFSGKLDGGFTSGVTVLAGPSKHFKTSFALLAAKAYMDKYKDSVCLFYDSEFGTPQAYFDSFGIDKSRVLHTPITDIEQLKFDVMKQMDGIKRGDKVIFVVDSIGNLASKKEVEDALSEKSVGDMTRAKQLKSIFRMVTPHLNLKDLPMVVVNHIYMEQGAMYPKAIVSGGTGIYYSADTIWIIGRSQEKEGTEVTGYNFNINIEKSRFTREKSKIPVTVMHKGGISKWSGLMDMALVSGHVIKPSNGWYQKVDVSSGEIAPKKYRLADTESKEFWGSILEDETFKQWVEETYRVASGSIMTDDEIDAEMEEV